MGDGPKTLLEAVEYFKDQNNCIRYLAAKRWQCSARHPKRQFSIKVGTIMEDSPLGLDKWMPVLWFIANCRNGISSWEIHRHIGVTQKTAWFMLQRVRLAMQDDLTGGMLGGEVEVDETFIGGKARNQHKKRRVEAQKEGRNTGGKTVVVGILERGSKSIRATVAPDRTKRVMQEAVRGNVEKGSQIHSDEAARYWKMDDEYRHNVVNHLEAYVQGNVHTNGLENFWSLLKRGLNGTYISVEPFHLFRYVDEQAFRYNNRLTEDGGKVPDSERFSRLCSQIVGRRLTYKKLIGAKEEPSDF